MMLSIPGYRIFEKIHESLNSRVYRGMREGDTLPVIVKILRKDYPTPEEITRYKLEYEIISRLNLNGVAKAYSFQQYENTFAIVLEDFGGESLEKLMASRSFTLADFLELGIKITRTLGEIHAANIIHKDINPSNIVFNYKTKQLKIIDFGNSTDLLRENPSAQNINELEGTLAYISPEQTGRMNRALDYRTDFYSLGATLYQMFTGCLPFKTTDALELIHSHLAKEPISPHPLKPHIPKAVSKIVMKLLAKSAEDRYQTAAGLEADLKICLEQLQTRGKIKDWTIASQDISDTFQISHKLYGREKEVDIILEAFERVTGKISPYYKEIMLVSGYSGIGKSALVKEIYKPITRQKGYFISAKFDQHQRNVPYSAIARAFEELIRQFLTESEARVLYWKEKILSALGSNAEIMVKLIPELEFIIGSCVAVPELLPIESQNRFNLTFQNFIRVFARPEHPLVIFLDDLQWADNASLKLMQSIVKIPDISSLFLIGAYRDREVDESHPLTIALAEIRKAGAVVNQISLAPLSLTDINQLIGDTLRCNLEDSQALAELVRLKSGGNPFFMNEFLKSLYSEGLLKFDRQTQKWQWSVEQILARGITDNVVELMALEIQKLSEPTQKILHLAACIGDRFELEILAMAASTSVKATALWLHEAIVKGSIVPLTNAYKSVELRVPLPKNSPPIEYKFAHDRIQQAAYSLISPAGQKLIHKQIGQLLWENTPSEKLEERIFDIVTHLNLARESLFRPQEREELARLNAIAGRKALSSTAYKTALELLQIGLELVEKDCWQKHYDLSLTLHNSAAEAAYLSGNFEVMEQSIEVVLENAKTVSDKIKAYEIKIQAHSSRSRFLSAIEIVRQALKLLGVDFPEKPSPADIRVAFSQTSSKLSLVKFEDLVELPKARDPIASAILRLLSNVNSAAYQAAPDLFPLIVLKMVDSSIEYGNAAESAIAYCLYGVLLNLFSSDLDSSDRFAELALKLSANIADKTIECKVRFVANTSIKFWKSHLKETIKPFLEIYKLALENGQLEYAGYSLFHYCDHYFFTGLNLSELEEKIAFYIQTLDRLGEVTSSKNLRLYQQTVFILLSASSFSKILKGEVYDESIELPLLLQANNQKGLFYFYFNKLLLCYYFEDIDGCIENIKLAENHLNGAKANAILPLFYLYSSLAYLSAHAKSSELEKRKILERVASSQQKMKLWAEHAPMNYQHKYYLIEAELHRISGKDMQAMDEYDRSIALAREQEYLQEEALGNELAAKFYLNKGKTTIARAYMQEARYCYSRWGAKAKVEDLERRYGELLEQYFGKVDKKSSPNISGKNSSGLEALELAKVLEASRAIAREIVLDKLLTKTMKIVIENAGAQTGYLLLPSEGKFSIEAIASVDRDKVVVLESIPVDGRLPEAIVNYVARIRASVVLENASAEGQFKEDPWIIQNQTKSILCTPLLDRNQLTGIVYLENNLTAGAFSAERIEIVKLLSTQAAISIDNARLLKQKEELNQALQVEIEERKQAERERERLISILEASTDCIGIANSQGIPLWINARGRKIFNLPLGTDISQKSIAEFHPAWAAEIVLKQGMPAAIRDGIWVGETALLADNGIEIPVSQMLIAHRSSNGDLEYFSTIIRDISYLKATREKLRTSRERLNDILNSIDDVVWSVSLPDFQNLYASPAIEKIYQRPYQSFFTDGNLWFEALHREDRSSLQDITSRVLERGWLEIEYRIVRPNGEIRWLFDRMRVVRDSSGAPIRIDGIASDITERKQLEMALCASQAKLRDILDSAIGAIVSARVLSNREWEYEYFSAGCQLICGYTPSELMADKKLWSSRILREDWENVVLPAFEDIFAERTVTIEYRIRHKDGSLRWVCASRSSRKDEVWDCWVVTTVVTDISDRQRLAAERERVSAERDRLLERLQTIMERMPVGLILNDLNFRITYWNPAAEKIFGFTRAEMSGKTPYETIVPECARSHLETIQQRIRNGDMFAHGLNENLTKDGRIIYCEWHNTPLFERDGSFAEFMSMALDVSDRVRAEEEIRKLNAELEERVKERTAQLEIANKELEAFSYSVSHDLRAPLRAIDGFSRLLQQKCESQLDSEANGYLEIVREQAQRMGMLIDDLLKFSRASRKSLQKQLVRPNVLIQKALKDLQPELENRQVELQIAELPSCQADSSLLQQVWFNLLSNAIKYTKYKPIARIEIDTQILAGETVYSIRDNGAGFDMRYADKLFGVFQRLHRASEFEGTGVGLALAQRIITRHGGRIWAEASPDRGATFYFTLSED